MRVFLSEHLTCGAADAGADSPLFPEGAAMLRALAADAAKIDGADVVVTWDGRLPDFGVAGVEVRRTADPRHEAALFRTLAAECDATLHVAPEFRDLLATRAEWVAEVGGRWSGCTPRAVRLCGDKLALHRHLADTAIRTPAFGDVVDGGGDTVPPPFVVKPRHGAGGDGLVVRDFAAYRRDLDALLPRLAALVPGDRVVVEELIDGRACSVAVCGDAVLPAGEQDVLTDGPLRWLAYRGGRVPADGIAQDAVATLVGQVRDAVPGLAGWWGIDFVRPHDPADPSPVLIEVNPRLTTSYLGSRALTRENLAERILFPERVFPPPRWESGTAAFMKDGRVRLS